MLDDQIPFGTGTVLNSSKAEKWFQAKLFSQQSSGPLSFRQRLILIKMLSLWFFGGWCFCGKILNTVVLAYALDIASDLQLILQATSERNISLVTRQTSGKKVKMQIILSAPFFSWP